MTIRATINRQGTIGKVTVASSNKTTIASPSYKPKLNVSFSDISDANTDIRQDGDTLVFNATTGEYESRPISNVSVVIGNVNGGTF